jgi:phosphoenolpyruvate synthase/pyruvate phosphate dikinase
MSLDPAQQRGFPLARIMRCAESTWATKWSSRWLLEQGITSISLNPDAAIKTAHLIAEAESAIDKARLAAA